MFRLLARTPMTETRGGDRFSVRGCLGIGQQCLIDSTRGDSGVPI